MKGKGDQATRNHDLIMFTQVHTIYIKLSVSSLQELRIVNRFELRCVWFTQMHDDQGQRSPNKVLLKGC